MLGIPKSFERLAAELQRLPGIGAKSAARLAARSAEERDKTEPAIAWVTVSMAGG